MKASDDNFSSTVWLADVVFSGGEGSVVSSWVTLSALTPGSPSSSFPLFPSMFSGVQCSSILNSVFTTFFLFLFCGSIIVKLNWVRFFFQIFLLYEDVGHSFLFQLVFQD